MTNNYAINAENIWKNFRLYHERNQFLKAAILRGKRAKYEEFWALKDVSFEIREGTSFGIIGSNGSGKSTLLKVLSGILVPDRGRFEARGRVSGLLELGAGFHPELSGRENVFLNGAILGLKRKAITEKFDEIVEFAGLEKFIDVPVKNYSSGMFIRLGFSVAAHVEPDILLIDEVLSVGDEQFQRKSQERIEQFRREGRTIVFVSHGLGQVQELCSEVAWLEKGGIRSIGVAKDVISEYRGDGLGSANTNVENLERWGSGEVRIASIEMVGPNDESTDLFPMGRDIKMRVELETAAHIQDPEVLIFVHSSDGVLIWEGSSRRHGITIGKVAETSTSITCSIVSLPVPDGVYEVSVAVRQSYETEPFDFWKAARRFTVSQHGTPDHGAILTDSKWTVSGADSIFGGT